MNWEHLKQQYKRFKEWQRHPIEYHMSDAEHLCQNCGCTFTGNFCPCCSQKAGIGRINWASVHQGVMDIWGLGTRSLIYSLWQLLLRPGHIIDDYISGKRQMSFPPVKMLFILTLLYSFVVYWLLPIFIDFNVDSQALRAMGDYATWQQSHYSWVMLIMAVMAIIPTWLLFRHAPGYNQHTVPEGFFIQVFMGILLVIFLTLDSFEVSLAMWLSVVYYFITYHQLFGYGWWPTIWRTLLCWYGAVMVGITIAAIYEVPARAKNDLPRLITEMAVTAVVMLLFAVVPLGLGYLIGHFNERRRRQSIIAKTKTKEYVQEDCTDNNDACVGSADASAEATSD